MATPRANRRGALLMVAAMACYVVNDALVKLTAAHLPPGQVLAVRGVFAIAFLLALASALSGLRGDWRAIASPIVGLRCLLEVGTATASVIALTLAPLAVVTALMMTAPLMISVSTMALGWERWHARSIAAALLGLAGVVAVVRPEVATAFSAWGAASALLCAAMLAGRELATRRLPPHVPSWRVALAAAAAVCAAGASMSFAEEWQPFGARETALLAAAAAAATLGNLALIAACRATDLSVVAPFRYSIVVWALIIGQLIWGDALPLLAVFGVALIVAGGVLSSTGSAPNRPS
jgi:drug/metabolite transporter (DMT)-like permease